MDVSHIVCALLGCSALFLVVVPEIHKMLHRKRTTQKLKMIREALREAEDRVFIHEERHDRLLSQICSHYMINQNLQDALNHARDAMNEAADLAIALRKLQTDLISSFSP